MSLRGFIANIRHGIGPVRGRLRRRPTRGRVGPIGRLLRDTRGAAFVEFAIVGPTFLLLLLAIIENGLILFTQSMLDNATRDAARMLLTGQGNSFSSKLCGDLSSIMSCNNLQYRVQAGGSFGGLAAAYNGSLTGFQAYPTAPTTGSASQYVLVQVAYNRTFLIPWVGKYLGTGGKDLLMSTQAFVNEPYP
jgi:Flp pilus assembly protein TadG